MDTLIDLLKKQKSIELSVPGRLRGVVDKVPNKLVSTMLETVIYDSQKHAAICKALIDLEAGEIPTRLDVDMATANEMTQTIKQHIRIEAEMIQRLEEMLKMVKDDRIEAILRYMLADEHRHHDTLTNMANLLDRDLLAFDEYLKLAQTYMFTGGWDLSKR
ncbi:MAG: ferritin family protein [Candidatus Bathyarchaeia archaeon]